MKTYICASGDGEVVGERAVRDPLLRAGDHPLVAVALGVGLQPADVAAGERLADREADELLAVEHLWDDLGLQFGRPVVEHGREADDLPRKEAIDIASRAEAANLKVDDELQGRLVKRNAKQTRIYGGALRGNGRTLPG